MGREGRRIIIRGFVPKVNPRTTGLVRSGLGDPAPYCDCAADDLISNNFVTLLVSVQYLVLLCGTYCGGGSAASGRLRVRPQQMNSVAERTNRPLAWYPTTTDGRWQRSSSPAYSPIFALPPFTEASKTTTTTISTTTTASTTTTTKAPTTSTSTFSPLSFMEDFNSAVKNAVIDRDTSSKVTSFIENAIQRLSLRGRKEESGGKEQKDVLPQISIVNRMGEAFEGTTMENGLEADVEENELDKEESNYEDITPMSIVSRMDTEEESINDVLEVNDADKEELDIEPMETELESVTEEILSKISEISDPVTSRTFNEKLVEEQEISELETQPRSAKLEDVGSLFSFRVKKSKGNVVFPRKRRPKLRRFYRNVQYTE